MSQPQQPAQPYPAPGMPAAPPPYGPPPGWGTAAPAPYQGAPVPPAFQGAPAYGTPAYAPAGAPHPVPQGYAGQPPATAHPYPAQQYPGQSFPAQPFAGQQPHPGQMPFVACRLCGSVPAVDTTFRGHQGMLVLMRFLSTKGPFCRDCGLGIYRHMTSRTLLQGWYGYASFVITPFTVLTNVIRRSKVARLAPPQPNPYAPSQAPMNPGPSLLGRPLTYLGVAIPITLIVLLIAIVTSGN